MYTISVLTYAGAQDLCGIVIQKVQIGCNANEQKYKWRCFKKCSLLTNGRYPLRKGRNTCSTVPSCPKGHEIFNGKCYKKCKKGYSAHGFFCWRKCSDICGKGYHKWKLSPMICIKGKKVCKNKSYYRGKGVLPYKSLTKGDKLCKGFAVNNKGRCPKIDISSRVPSSIIKC